MQCFEDTKETKILKLAGDWDKLEKKLFTHSIVDKTYETIQKNQGKIDRTGKLKRLLLTDF